MDTLPPDQHVCSNCQHPLGEKDRFCPNCGQKVITKRITVWELLQDFWDTVFSIDSKIFRTLAALLRPGRLSSRYFSGQHGRYLPPIRIFFFSLVVFVFSLSFELNTEEVTLPDLGERYQKIGTYQHALEKLDSSLIESLEKVPVNNAQEFSDTLRETFLRRLPTLQDSIDLNEDLAISSTGPFIVSVEDLNNLSADSIILKYQVEGLWDQIIQKQKIRFIQNGDALVPSILGKVTWMILLMMPFLALFLKLIYIRRPIYFVEHLVFSFHTHSFLFLFLSLMEFTGDSLPIEVTIGLLLIIPVYLYLGMKHFYVQGYIKTLFKLIILAIAYAFIGLVFLLLTFLVGFLFF